MLRISFEGYEFGFKCFEFGLNGYSNASNLLWIFRICIRMLRIPFECLDFAFENPFELFKFAFECLSNGWSLHWNASNPFSSSSNLDSNASNPFRVIRILIGMLRMSLWVVQIWIRMLRIPFGWFEFAIKCFESCSKGSNLHSNAWNLVRMVTICIRMFWIFFEWLELTFMVLILFEWLDASTPFRMVKICIECFESLSNGSNFQSNPSNSYRMVRIRMLRITLEGFKFGF